MREHIAIRVPVYVAGTRERPEVGVFTQTHATRHPVPWGKIATGECVWMKWSGGPIVAKAIVAGFRQLEGATPEEVRATVTGFCLHDLEEYWKRLHPHVHALTVYLDQESWLEEPIDPGTRSRGESWIVLDSDTKRAAWLTTQTGRTGKPSAHARRGRTRTISASVRFQVLRRDDFRCTYCGQKPPDVVLHIDHVEPFSAGGGTTMANLRTACSRCNLGKGAMRL